MLGDEHITVAAPAGVARKNAAAVRILLRANRVRLSDGEDVVIASASALDADGEIVPIDSDEIEFRVNGMGRYVTVGNGRPKQGEPGGKTRERAFNAISMTIAKIAMVEETLLIEATSGALEPAELFLDFRPRARQSET